MYHHVEDGCKSTNNTNHDHYDYYHHLLTTTTVMTDVVSTCCCGGHRLDWRLLATYVQFQRWLPSLQILQVVASFQQSSWQSKLTRFSGLPLLSFSCSTLIIVVNVATSRVSCIGATCYRVSAHDYSQHLSFCIRTIFLVLGPINCFLA